MTGVRTLGAFRTFPALNFEHLSHCDVDKSVLQATNYGTVFMSVLSRSMRIDADCV